MMQANCKGPVRRHMSIVIALGMMCFGAGANASFVNPFDPFSESYTFVKIESHQFGTGTNSIGEANLLGSTSFSGTVGPQSGTGGFDGEVIGSGLAHYDRLGASVHVVDGAGVHDGYTLATANDIYTVTPPPGVAVGEI